MLKWEINFIKLDVSGANLVFSREFINGKLKVSVPRDERLIFVNYISLFPNKDIVRLDMNLYDNLLYSFFYIDKTYLDKGFIGVFGCEEFNTREPYVWEKTESVAKEIFKQCNTLFKDAKFDVSLLVDSLDVWFEIKIPGYFKQFRDAKDVFSDKQKAKSREKLVDLFQSASKAKKKNNRKGINGQDSLDDGKIKKLQSMIDRVAYDQLYATEGERQWLTYNRRFDFMLINAFGNPLTDILNFQNGKRLAVIDEMEETVQSLEGMTYSVLKSFVDQQSMHLHKMIVKRKEGNGYEHIFFHNFAVDEVQYLIIMNVENFNPKENYYLSKLNGDESPTMDRISVEIRQNSRLFTKDGQFINNEAKRHIEGIFAKHCEITFFQ